MKRFLLVCCLLSAAPAFSEEFKIGPDILKVTRPEQYRMCIATRRPQEDEYRTMFMNVGEKDSCPTDPEKFNEAQQKQVTNKEIGFLKGAITNGPVRDNEVKLGDEKVEYAFINPLVVGHKLTNGKYDYVCTTPYRRVGEKEPIGQVACPIVRDGEGKAVIREITVKKMVEGEEKEVKTRTFECPQIGGDDGCAKKDLMEASVAARVGMSSTSSRKGDLIWVNRNRDYDNGLASFVSPTLPSRRGRSDEVHF